MWPVADGIDHDEVVVLLPHLPGELADREDLLHAGRGVGDEVEACGPADRCGPAAGPSAGGSRYSFSDSSVSIDIANRSGCTSRGLKVFGPDSKKSARLPLASTSQTSVRLPCAAPSSAERGGDAGLADPALAGDEEQPPVEQVGAVEAAMASSSRTRSAVVVGAADLDVRDFARRDADLAACRSVSHSTFVVRQGLVDLAFRASGRCRRPARRRSPEACGSHRCERPRDPPRGRLLGESARRIRTSIRRL